jgi:ATPase family associated with various cellular activities (AAA)
MRPAIVAALAALGFLAPWGAAAERSPAAASRPLLAFGKACELKGLVNASAFERNLKVAERQRPGWVIVLRSEEAELRLAHAKQIAEAAAATLHPVDASALVGTYIGETEKNLDALLEQAKRLNWVLFFDEADALFGKRTEVKDAHDRYARESAATLADRLLEQPHLVVLGTRWAIAFERESAKRTVDVVIANALRKADVVPPLPWKTLCTPRPARAG